MRVENYSVPSPQPGKPNHEPSRALGVVEVEDMVANTIAKCIKPLGEWHHPFIRVRWPAPSCERLHAREPTTEDHKVVHDPHSVADKMRQAERLMRLHVCCEEKKLSPH
jgi:hypothetical protein